MFVVFTNETDGVNLHGQETACELHKRKLIEATYSRFVEFQQEFDNILALSESEDDARNLLEEIYVFKTKDLIIMKILLNLGRIIYMTVVKV